MKVLWQSHWLRQTGTFKNSACECYFNEVRYNFQVVEVLLTDCVSVVVAATVPYKTKVDYPFILFTCLDDLADPKVCAVGARWEGPVFNSR